MPARDIMTTQVVTVHPSATLEEAMKLIVEIEISGLIVVDQNSDIVGVVTEKDLLVGYDFLCQIKAPIAEFMNRQIISVTEDTPIEEISKLLVQRNILRVPVVRGKKVVGVVSRRDILRHILKANKKQT